MKVNELPFDLQKHASFCAACGDVLPADELAVCTCCGDSLCCGSGCTNLCSCDTAMGEILTGMGIIQEAIRFARADDGPTNDLPERFSWEAVRRWIDKAACSVRVLPQA
jgi:hypothetical protein